MKTIIHPSTKSKIPSKQLKHPSAIKKIKSYTIKLYISLTIMTLGALAIIPFIYRKEVILATDTQGKITNYQFGFYGIPVANEQIFYGIALAGVFIILLGFLLLLRAENKK